MNIRVSEGVVRTLNSSLNSLLSSAILRLISSSSLSIESGGYFLFVLGERANSGTLWSSAPAARKGGDTGGAGGVGQVEIIGWGRSNRARNKESDRPLPGS